MKVTCGECGKEYDDTYRLTLCPHDPFPMRTVVYRGGRRAGTARTVAELHALIRQDVEPTIRPR